ncbi:hypothetical protein RI367_005704 [Sorochytrium milnesiophthora]
MPSLRATDNVAHFRKVCAADTPFGIPIAKYVSSKTGLEVAIVDVEGTARSRGELIVLFDTQEWKRVLAPIVSGYFTVATEEAGQELDKGQPHTLEHLVFLGSEDYPYKGVLDSLANRALAQGTNAWTATDHTCYTITTAGEEGFRNLMPIFLDHILHPTLTEAGYVTEVHHITGKGEDAGVVYCEMQGRENTEGDLMQLQISKLLHPAPSGYGSETGGLMRKLRELSIESIRNYHRAYYRADNLCVIIIGKVDHEKMLQALVPVDEKVMSKGPRVPHPRPWVDSKPSELLKASVTKVVEFPDDEESTGAVVIAYRGYQATDHRKFSSLETLFSYLTDSPVALLNKVFVELEAPECSDINSNTEQCSESTYALYFQNVGVDYLETIGPKFIETIQKLVNDEPGFGIDMERMKLVIDRRRLNNLNQTENDPQDTMTVTVISDFLYGDKSGGDLAHFANTNEFLEEQLTYTKEQWVSLVKESLLDTPAVTCIGQPSAAMAERLAADEKARIKKQQETLGEAKLAKLGEKLDKAMEENNRPIPQHIITDFPIPSLDINFPTVVTASTAAKCKSENDLQKFVDEHAQSVPYFVEFDEIQSQFIVAALYFDTAALPRHLRLYLELYLECMFSLPITSPRGTLTHEEVVNGLNRDLVSHTNNCGQGGSAFRPGSFATQLCVSARVEATQAKYKRGLEWLEDLVFYGVFDPERLVIAAKKLLSDVPRQKRDGSTIASLKMRSILLNSDSNYSATNLVNQTKFLQDVLARLQSSPQSVVKDLEEFRAIVTKPEHMRVHVYGAVRRIDDAVENVVDKLTPVKLSLDYLTPLGRKPTSVDSAGKPVRNSQIVTLASIESGYLFASARGIEKWDHPDYAALMVLCEYFDTTEGLFWKQIRGPGLAYGAGLYIEVGSGQLSLAIYRSADAFAAYQRAKEIVASVVSGETPFDDSLIDAAKASTVFSIVGREDTPVRAAQERWTNAVFQQSDAQFNRQLLRQLGQVQKSDLVRVLKQYLSPLFQKETSVVVVASGPGKAAEIKAGFAGIGIEMEEQKLDDVFGDIEDDDDDHDHSDGDCHDHE